jgi:hypothetical protein
MRFKKYQAGVPMLRLVIGCSVPDDPKTAEVVSKLMAQRYAGMLEAARARMREARAVKRAYCLAWALVITWVLIGAGVVGWCFKG